MSQATSVPSNAESLHRMKRSVAFTLTLTLTLALASGTAAGQTDAQPVWTESQVIARAIARAPAVQLAMASARAARANYTFLATAVAGKPYGGTARTGRCAES